MYLSNGEEFYKEYLDSMSIPTYSDTCTSNPIRFSNCGGYIFATTYIEYLDVAYGWDSVLELIKTEDYMHCFGKSQKIYTKVGRIYKKLLSIKVSTGFKGLYFCYLGS